jgi:hypothetical protein
MVVSKVRRSERIKDLSLRVVWKKTCFCCSIEPPTLSTKVIRSLGNDFCKIQGKLITDAELEKKHLAKKVARTKAK